MVAWVGISSGLMLRIVRLAEVAQRRQTGELVFVVAVDLCARLEMTTVFFCPRRGCDSDSSLIIKLN